MFLAIEFELTTERCRPVKTWRKRMTRKRTTKKISSRKR
jgi:hypothetical protein